MPIIPGSITPIRDKWHGEPVAGCRFLLVGEQGRGDEIQFLRFAEWLNRQGAVVDVLVSQPIAELAASMTGVQTVFTTLPPGPYNYWCHMLRMPEHVKLDLPMLPIAMPYLAATSEKLSHWKVHIEAIPQGNKHAKNKRVGVVWAGSSHHVLDRYRSIQLAALKPLFGLSAYSGERDRQFRRNVTVAHGWVLRGSDCRRGGHDELFFPSYFRVFRSVTA